MGASLQHRSNSGGRSRSRRRQAERRLVSEINVTPFVDVMLVLLIIFMVAAPMLNTGVQVNLPEAKAPALPTQDEPLAISVNKKGEVFLNKNKVKLDGLVSKLQAIATARDTRNPPIIVRGDSAASYGTLMQVIARINAAGMTRIALETSPQ